MISRRIHAALLPATLFLLAAPAGADVLFDNFAPGDRYFGNRGWSVANGGPFGAHIEEAVSFSAPDNSYFLDSAEIAIGILFGPNVLFATLHADSGLGGGSPGAMIETIEVRDQMLPFPNDETINNPPVVLQFSGASLLQQGLRYWISVSTDTSTDTWAAWNENITGDRGQRAYRQDGGAWNVFDGNDLRGTFRINGTPVPAPGAVVGVFGLSLFAVRRRGST